MSAALPKVLCLKKGVLLKQVFALSRAATPRESRLCAAGGALVSCHRHYRARPTHGIGRFKYLLPKEAPKRRKDRVQMKEISVGTEYEYGDVNIQMTSYDMCLVEHFAQYVHKLCNRLSIRVNESYAMPTKTNEVLFLEERGSKMQLDAVLTTHQRVVQVTRRVEAEEGFMDYVIQPEDLLPILCIILDTRGGKVMFKDEQLDKLDEISKYISIKASFKSVKLVEIRGLSSTFAPILLEIIQSSQPEGVHLLVKEHTEADFKSRLKSRPELEELLAQMN